MLRIRKFINPLFYVWFLALFALILPIILLVNSNVSWLIFAFALEFFIGFIIIRLEINHKQKNGKLLKRPTLFVMFSVLMIAVLPENIRGYIIFGTGGFLLAIAIVLTILRVKYDYETTWDDIIIK